MKEKYFDINDPVFKTGIRVYYKKAPACFGDIPDTCNARTLTDNPYNPCIWLRDTQNIEVIVHELVHCVADIHRKKGIPQNSDTEEVFAYMMGYYFSEIMRFSYKKIKNNPLK